MAYEIIETQVVVGDGNGGTSGVSGSRFTVIDPHPEFPIVESVHHNRADAEEALAEIKRDEAITDSFDAWIHAAADEHGVNRQTVANLINVDQFR